MTTHNRAEAPTFVRPSFVQATGAVLLVLIPIVAGTGAVAFMTPNGLRLVVVIAATAATIIALRAAATVHAGTVLYPSYPAPPDPTDPMSQLIQRVLDGCTDNMVDIDDAVVLIREVRAAYDWTATVLIGPALSGEEDCTDSAVRDVTA